MENTNYSSFTRLTNDVNNQVSKYQNVVTEKDVVSADASTNNACNGEVILSLSSEGKEQSRIAKSQAEESSQLNREQNSATRAVKQVSTNSRATTTLKVGSKGSEVTTLQKNLTSLGYDTKGTDGVFGNDTKAAVVSFQKAYGLTADGVVGTATQNQITKALDNKMKGILTVGSRGQEVKDLQTNLTKLGYNTNGTDGIFGDGTKNAVIAFQKANGLTADGVVGSDTKNKIDAALKASQTPTPTPSTGSVSKDKMISNLQNDTSLGLSSDKKTAMIKAATKLLEKGYEPEFVAGVLGNIQNEGTPGIFESSNYKSNPSAEPAYLVYADKNFDYRNKFSGKSIQDVGISAAIDLENKAKASGFKGKFGLGMIQWTGGRTEGLLQEYKKVAKSDKPTKDECIQAEVNYMIKELEGDYSKVYTNWKKGSKTASSAGDIVCRQYEVPKDTDGQAKARANNATKIYNVMMKK